MVEILIEWCVLEEVMFFLEKVEVFLNNEWNVYYCIILFYEKGFFVYVKGDSWGI